MKKILLFFVFSCACIGLSAQTQIIRDPGAQERSVGSFHEIKVSNAIDLYLSQGQQEAIAVSAKTDEFRDHIKTEVENGVLKIWYDDSKLWRSGNKKLKAYISFRSLNRITASGASDVVVSGTLQSDNLVLHFGGASDFKGAVSAGKLEVDISGASDMTINGKVSDLEIEASGASEFKGYDLTAENCRASASGASDIRITVNKELNARASGASSVNYKGSAVIRDLKTNGASNVSKKS